MMYTILIGTSKRYMRASCEAVAMRAAPVLFGKGATVVNASPDRTAQSVGQAAVYDAAANRAEYSADQTPDVKAARTRRHDATAVDFAAAWSTLTG